MRGERAERAERGGGIDTKEREREDAFEISVNSMQPEQVQLAWASSDATRDLELRGSHGRKASSRRRAPENRSTVGSGRSAAKAEACIRLSQQAPELGATSCMQNPRSVVNAALRDWTFTGRQRPPASPAPPSPWPWRAHPDQALARARLLPLHGSSPT